MITSLPRILESEPETSSTLKGSSVEEYLVIEQERRGEEEGGVYEGDEKSSGSPSSNGPILPDILASRYMHMQRCSGSFCCLLGLIIILIIIVSNFF